MRVLIIAYYFSDWRGGGSERNIADLGGYLMARGDYCLVAVPSTARVQLLEERNIPYVRVDGLRETSLRKFCVVVARMVSIIHEYKIDVQMIFTFRLLLHAFFASKIAICRSICRGKYKKIPVVVNAAMGWKPFERYLLWLFGLCSDRIIALTAYCSQHMKKSIFTRHKVVLIYHGAHVDKFFPLWQKRLNDRMRIQQKEQQVVGTVGRFTAQKAIHFLIEAAVSIVSEYKVRFLLVGEGQEEENLRALVIRLGLGEKITFMSARDMTDVLGEIDIFVTTSVSEGMPQALIEAMTAGIPAVATNIQGHSELILDGVTGILVPLGDTGKIAEAIKRLLADRQLAFRMGELANKRAVENFNLEVTFEKNRRLLYEVTNQQLPEGGSRT
ncbi:MAG: glycosyltransferase family 4 protein [Candidatus Omnitrophota bacterium]